MDHPPLPGTHSAASGGGTSLRLFVALRVEQESARMLAQWAEHTVDTTARIVAPSPVRAVDQHQLHLTWAWLGDVEEELLPAVANHLEDAASSLPGAVACSTIGTHILGAGRVLAAGIDIDLLVLLDAARDRFAHAVAPFAPQVDRRAWRPHVTLLRARTGSQVPEQLRTTAAPLPATTWLASDLRLIASLPSPNGRQHRELLSVPFGAPVRG